MGKRFMVSAMCVQLLFLASLAVAQEASVPVRGALVTALKTQKRQVLSGNLRSLRRSALSSIESGLLVEMRVRTGEWVQKGQLIAGLDLQRLQLAHEQARIAVHMAEADVTKQSIMFENQKNEFKRRQQANGVINGSVSEEVLEQAEVQVAVRRADQLMAKQRLSHAQNELELAALRLKDAEIFAPFDGFVVAQHAEIGEWITPGQAIITLVSSGKMEAVFEVPEQQAMSYVRKMKQLSLVVHGQQEPIVSKVFRVVPDVDARSRRYNLIVDVEADGLDLATGMSVTCAVASGVESEYLLVPSDALMRDVGGAFVYKVNQGMKSAVSEIIPVKVLFIEGDQVAFSAPSLSVGDQVVVEGNERLRPHMPLQLVQDGVEMAGEVMNEAVIEGNAK